MALKNTQVAALLAEAETLDAAQAVFEEVMAQYGYVYFDVCSFEAAKMADPHEACRYYLCNYLDGDPLDHLRSGWPHDDDVFAACCRSVSPLSYLEHLGSARRTTVNLWQRGLMTMWGIKNAWILPFNAIDRYQCVTVYTRSLDQAAFEASRWQVFGLAALFIERVEALYGQAQPLSSQIHPKGMSERELQCLNALRQGQSNSQIAARLGISENTVRFHMKRLFKKLGVKNRTEAALSDPS